MEIITGTNLQRLVDYDFGDHMGAASIPKPVGGFMKVANETNWQFEEECELFEGKVMTLFIDNIRLYNRNITVTSLSDAKWVGDLLENNDLLALCAKFPKNKFVIFCSHEDTPIDNTIKIPDNVLGIHAVNAEYFNDKIHPFPYGLQREMPNDNRLKDMKTYLGIQEACGFPSYHKRKENCPNKLLYINCGLGTERNNPERAYLVNFEGLSWATCRFDKDSKFFPYDQYWQFLNEIRNHKFMVCPQGHGLDCHRNWETLYMRRVPVMKDHPYFRKLMRGFPVLFVDDWSDITNKLLIDSEYLYEEALKMNLNALDLNKIFASIVSSYNV